MNHVYVVEFEREDKIFIYDTLDGALKGATEIIESANPGTPGVIDYHHYNPSCFLVVGKFASRAPNIHISIAPYPVNTFNPL